MTVLAFTALLGAMRLAAGDRPTDYQPEHVDGRRNLVVLVHGLTGRVQLKDGVLRDVNDHMLRNVMGDKDAERDGEAAR